MGGAGALPLPPSELLHLNQAGVQHLICNLTDAQASTLWHGHKGALKVRVDGCTEYWAFLIVVTPRDTNIVSTRQLIDMK